MGDTCCEQNFWVQKHDCRHIITLVQCMAMSEKNYSLCKAFSPCKPQPRLKRWDCTPGAGLHMSGMACSSMVAFPSHFALA